jgi:hypothetical protein
VSVSSCHVFFHVECIACVMVGQATLSHFLVLNLQDEKSRQHERVVAAQEDVAKSKAILDAVDEKLKPLIEIRKSKRTEQDQIKAAFNDLDVSLE